MEKMQVKMLAVGKRRDTDSQTKSNFNGCNELLEV